MTNTKPYDEKLPLNEYIDEFLDIHIRYSSLYKTSISIVWEIRGDLNEKEYYRNNVELLVKSIFDLELEPKFRLGSKNGCFGIQT